MVQLSRALGVSLPKPGQRDSANEDHWSSCIHPTDRSVAFHIVCDGVGASKHGREAAELACRTTVLGFSSRWTTPVSKENVVRDLLLSAHDCVRKKFPQGEAHCTVVAALVVANEHRLVIGHAGDSSAYLIQDGQIRKLTSSHTAPKPKIKHGKPVRRDGRQVMVQAISRFIGQSNKFEPEIASFEFRQGNLLCLASDGVPEGQLNNYFAGVEVMPNAQSIVRFCHDCRRESNDDTTLVVQQLLAAADSVGQVKE